MSSSVSLDVLKSNLENLSSSLSWLRRSYDTCLPIGTGHYYTFAEFDHFENLTSRYARTVDLLINKVLRSIDAVELIDSGSIIDVVNRAEKRGLIESVSELRNLKDLRNEIAHEYETEDIKKFFSLVLEAATKVFDIAEQVQKYCEKYTLYGLSEYTINTLKKIFKKYTGIEKAVLYGSRAKGNFKNGSDIDITLHTSDDFNDLYNIMRDIDESDMPYFVDVSIFKNIQNQDLKDHIERVGKTLYIREQTAGDGH
jgi:predicted nucleotidyltransferase/uncharacterized protein YutE (UPF0331/DUF86 family)